MGHIPNRLAARPTTTTTCSLLLRLTCRLALRFDSASFTRCRLGSFALGRGRHLLLAVVRLGGYVGLLDRLRRVDGRANLVVGEHPLEDLLRARRVLRSHDDER